MQSIWEDETFYRNRDFIVIGAGFTGLWTAISIKEKYPKKSVLIVERNAISCGASSRNAGFACFGSLTEIIADSEKIGWQKTLDLVKMRVEGLQKIQNYFKPEEIDFDLCGGFEILNNDHALQRIDEVNERLKIITNIDETFTLKNEKIETFGLKNAKYVVENPCEGSLHSGKLLQKLQERCQNLGVEFLFGTDVLEIVENKNFVKISTENTEIKTKKLVIATNAFTQKLLPKIELFPARGQILLTEPIENLKLKGTFHFDEGFYYFRNVGNRVLIGGARNIDFETEKTIELETTEKIQKELENFLKNFILPNEKELKIAKRWSGIMAMGKEKSPIVEKISERQIVAVRLSGMGVSLAPKIAEMVREIM